MQTVKVKKTKTKITDLLAIPSIENIPFDVPTWTETTRPCLLFVTDSSPLDTKKPQRSDASMRFLRVIGSD